MTFDEYLTSKKIDALAFQKAEPTLFQTWREEFEQMHVNSFTVQKLNLINPIRRKYQLKDNIGESVKTDSNPTPAASASTSPPRVARPVIKPKIN
jgi:hypothetical protein